jgi:hypothetical protein
MNRQTVAAAIGGALMLALAAQSGVAGPLAQSGAATAKAGEELGVLQLVDRCNRACRRGPVEEWGGVVRWHRHVGPQCRPVRCSPR